MQMVNQLQVRTKAKNKSKKKSKNHDDVIDEGLIVPELENMALEPLVKAFLKHGVLLRYEQTAPFSLKRSMDAIRGNVQVESLSAVEARMEGSTLESIVSTPSSLPSPAMMTSAPFSAPSPSPGPVLATLRRPFDAVRRSFDRPPIIRYDLPQWCRSEQFFYYLLRLIHEDLYTIWLQRCATLITAGNNDKVWDSGVEMIRDIRTELVNQRNRKRNAIARLHGHNFAERVLSMGTSYVSEAAHLLTGNRYHDETVTKQRFRFLVYIERFLFGVDRIIQKRTFHFKNSYTLVVIRRLHPEERTLINAIAKLERYVLMERHKDLASPSSPSSSITAIVDEYDEEYHMRRAMILKKQQTDALHLVHRYQSNPLVNMNRVLGGDRDESRMFFKEMMDPNMNQGVNHEPVEPEPVPKQKYAEGVDPDLDTKVDYMVDRDDHMWQRRLLRVKTFNQPMTEILARDHNFAISKFDPDVYSDSRKHLSIWELLGVEEELDRKDIVVELKPDFKLSDF
jgi:hypothetical protein